MAEEKKNFSSMSRKPEGDNMKFSCIPPGWVGIGRHGEGIVELRPMTDFQKVQEELIRHEYERQLEENSEIPSRPPLTPNPEPTLEELKKEPLVPPPSEEVLKKLLDPTQPIKFPKRKHKKHDLSRCPYICDFCGHKTKNTYFLTIHRAFCDKNPYSLKGKGVSGKMFLFKYRELVLAGDSNAFTHACQYFLDRHDLLGNKTRSPEESGQTSAGNN